METLNSSSKATVGLMLRYLKYWRIFLLSLILCLGLAFLYLQTQVPKYRITSTLLLQDDSKDGGLFKGTAFSDLNLFAATKTVYDYMEMLRSRDLIYSVLNQLHLQTKYSYANFITTEEVYGSQLPVIVNTLFLAPAAFQLELKIKPLNKEKYILIENGKTTIYKYGAVVIRPQYKITVQRGPAAFREGKPVLIAFRDLYKTAQAYSSAGLTVMPVIKDANTVVLTLIDPIPDRGIDILNTLLKMYNQENSRRKNQTALQTIDFINAKLKGLNAHLTGAEEDIENYKIKNRISLLNDDAQMNIQNSGAAGQQLSSTDVQLNVVNSLSRYLNNSKSTFELVPSTLGLKDPTLQNLTDKYNNLQVERQRLLRNTSELNPLVVTLTEQLSALKSSLVENLRMIKKGLLLEKENYRNQTAKSDSRLGSVPALERGLLERSREQGVKTTQYQYLLQKREETELSLSATIPSFQIVESPGYDPNPASPKVQLSYLISILAGLSLPMGVIYLREVMNGKVRETADAHYINTKGNILGELSHKAIGEAIVVEKGKSTNISELFRYIRSNLHFMDMEKLNKVMLVTSSSKGEGKTFFCINLGITLSLIGKKVVLLEFDLRKPDLLTAISLEQPGHGLSGYLAGQHIEIEELIMPVPASENLSVIGCGKVPDNPSELLESGRLELLIAELRQRFDYIIIDSSPVGYVADAFTIGQYADASIYLVRYNYTSKTDLSIFTEIAENKRLKNPMIVFNDAKKENKNIYRYGRYAYN
ncbi:MAG: polysaccharide biosynthesis tyrosine autokinase [Pedobacter sp.]|uniref:GumC family protein n=1 Tax=Pedobacter sp. TaxID=1411316 RepID=UPI0033908E2B